MNNTKYSTDMEKITIERTLKTPFLNFDPENGLIELRGRSILENAQKMYEPLVDTWLDEYLKKPADKTIVEIELDYFNTGSSMWILRLLKKLEALNDLQKQVVVNWYHSDEDMEESGADFKELVYIPVNLISLN